MHRHAGPSPDTYACCHFTDVQIIIIIIFIFIIITYILESHGSHLRLIGLLVAFCYPKLSRYILIFLHSVKNFIDH